MAQSQQGFGAVPMQNLADIGAHTIVQALQTLQACANGIAAICAQLQVSPQGFQGFGGLQAGGGMPGYISNPNPNWGGAQPNPNWSGAQQQAPIASTQLHASSDQTEQATSTGTGTATARAAPRRKTSTAETARNRGKSTKRSNAKTARGSASEGPDPQKSAAGKLGYQRRQEKLKQQQPQQTTGMHAAE